MLWLNSSLKGVAGSVRTNSFFTGINLAYTLRSAAALWARSVGCVVRTISLFTEIGLLYSLGSACALLAWRESKCCWCDASSYEYYQSYCYYSNETDLSYHYNLSSIVL
jgi:hypothetical protein